MNSPYFLAYPVAEKDMPEALKKTKLPPYPVLALGPLRLYEGKTIRLCHNREYYNYAVDDMVYAESGNKRLAIYFRNKAEPLYFRITLRKLKKLLGKKFVQISDHCLVKENFIAECGNWRNPFVKLNVFKGKMLTITRSYIKKLMAWKKKRKK